MRYLSDEWIEAADAAVSGLEPSSEPFAVGYMITGGPDGERSYTLDLSGPSVGPDSEAPVGLSMTWDIARAIATGELSAQRAFLDGNMRVRGDVQALVGNAEGLLAIETALAGLRAATTY